MLVLSRNIGEAVKIGDEIEVVVHSIRGNQVKLSFTAPRNIEILREELVNQADRRKRKSLDTRS